MRFILLLTILTTCRFVLVGATLYVREGASGAANGADWSNAYINLPATLARGDTYYVADGNYGGRTFGTAVSGSTLITIKKATVADHGTSTGWSDTYGDGQAVWTGWSITTSYWLIDGQVGGGYTSGWTTGLGFKVYNPSFTNGAHLIDSGGSPGVTDVAIRHTEITFGTHADTGVYGTGIYFASGSTRLSFQYCAMHNIPGDIAQMRSANDLLVEQCYFSDNLSVPAKHGDVWEHDGNALNQTFRYNWFKDCVGSYAISDQSGAGNPTNVFVYGNIFSWTAGGGFSNGILGTDTSGGPIVNGSFHNNTVFAMNSGQLIYCNGGSSVTAYNNIIYGTSGGGGSFGWVGVTSHDYNAFRYAGVQSEANIQNFVSNPFLDTASGNFLLIANTQAGLNLGSPYNVDMKGSFRTFWTRGAFEYSTALKPASPTNLRITP